MVGVLFWRTRGVESLIYAAFTSAQEELTRDSLLHILWKEGCRQAQRQGSFPSRLNIQIQGPPHIKASLSVSPEANRLDLNQAEDQDLFEYFLRHHISGRKARIMTDSLLDWRDPDNLHRLNGAEKDYYRPLGYEPRNGPLKDLSEATLIRGFDAYRFWFRPGIYKWVTIYGGQKTLPEAEETPTLKLQAHRVYRLELSWEENGKTFRYLEIFRYKGGKRVKLFSFSW